MNLTEALQRWCELEPLRCAVLQQTPACIGFFVQLNGDSLLVFPQLSSCDRLEYGVREAIEARGLYWSIERVSNELAVYFGRVQRIKGFRWVESSSSAAHALLLAYIAYLEALAT